MTELNIKDYIRRELSSENQEIALDFVAYLENNGLTFYKDNGDCWKDKIYYWCKYNNDCVCFISIKDTDEPQNLLTVWSDDIKSEWLDKFNVEAVLYSSLEGKISWLEYNLKRSLGIECADENERKLGTEQVIYAIGQIERYVQTFDEITACFNEVI